MEIEKDTMPSTRLQLTVLSLMSLVGGYADASSYMLANSFTGHITGNTVLAALSLAKGDIRDSGIRFLAIACFLIATALGAALTRKVDTMTTAFIPVLILEAIFVLAAPFGQLGHYSHASTVLVGCLCLALGLQNGAYRKALGKGVHTTYVTGDVTTMLVNISGESAKPERSSSESKRADMRATGLVWTAFAGGAITAGVAVHFFHARALWLIELPIVLIASITWRLCHQRSLPL